MKNALPYFEEEKYKENAIYWIRTLLAFTHMWEPPNMPMLYNTKPVLSSSDWYFANWVRGHVRWDVLRVLFQLYDLISQYLCLPFLAITPSVKFNNRIHRILFQTDDKEYLLCAPQCTLIVIVVSLVEHNHAVGISSRLFRKSWSWTLAAVILINRPTD